MKVIIVSGVSRGLGREILKLLLPTSNRIVCIGKTLPDIVSDLSQKVIFIKQDMSDEFHPFSSLGLGIDESVQDVVFINNAATIEPIAHVGNLTCSDISNSIKVNLEYPACFADNLVAICKERNIGLRILNISTGASQRPIAGWALYCATKAATRMFFDCLELEGNDVTIKHIDPGVMDTGMQETIRNTPKEDFPDRDKFLDLKANNMLQQPNHIAKEILSNEDCL